MISRPALRRGLPAALLAALLGAVPLSATSAAAAPADASIAGSVTEADAPVGRVEVSAYRWDDEESAYVFEQETETASDGTWSLDFLPDGEYTLQYDTSVSNARFALGESLGGNPSYTDDSPIFEIADGASSAAPFAEHELERWGGEVTLSVTEDETTLIDLDDAVARLQGIDLSGAPVESQREYANESGAITISRVPAGGYVPWVAARGEAASPASTDTLVFPGSSTDLGALPLGTAPEDAFTAGAPTLTGEARAGETLTVVDPDIAPDPESISHRWSSGDVPLEETSATLELTDALVGEPATAWVFAHRAGTAPFIAMAVSDPVAAAIDDADPNSDADAEAGAGADASGSSTAGGAGADATDSSSADASGTAGAESDASSNAGSSAGADGGDGSGAGDGSLPITGAGIAGIVALGAALLAAGAILVLRRRARLGSN
ncbi:LPXTG cell wall anchor domain-containing protein [Leucobacter sp. USCH14]|uniref:LPXTG cell wall anchor domain-containing protein n=1 Tax=Leucobacter sp. USCH14 TaxID=3024838 RepID=UPI0030A840E6